MTKKTVIVGVAVLLLVAAGVGWFWPFLQRQSVLRLPGIVEIQEVRLGSKIGGRVKEIAAEEGSHVQANQPLVTFETPELEAQRSQLEARVRAMEADYEKARNGPRWEEKMASWAAAESARAKFERMKNGPRKEETEKARSDFASAEADYKQSLQDFQRIAELYKRQAASRAEFDAAMAVRDRLQGRLRSAQSEYEMHIRGSRQEDIDQASAEWQKSTAKLAELLQGTRAEVIAEAKARLDEARGKLKELLANLAEAVVRSPKKAIVEVINVRKGDLVAPNQPIVRVLYEEDLWIKAYVPEPELGKIRLDQHVEISIDTYPGKRFSGTIKFISPVSEFTPRNVQSLDERHHQVFAIKVRVDNSQDIFHAGMAADVLVPVPPAP